MIHPTTKLTLAILLSAMAMAPGASAAIEIKLRDWVQANNSVIRLSDVADIAGASPTQARKLAALPLMPAPAEGGQRFLRKREIEDLLVAHGVDLRALSVNGADQVTITAKNQKASGNRAPVTMNRHQAVLAGFDESAPSATIDAENAKLLSDDVGYLVKGYLSTKVPGGSQFNVSCDVAERHLALLQTATSRPVCEGGAAPWTGKQRFVISFDTADGAARIPVYASIRPPAKSCVVALRPLARGDVITAADVEIQSVNDLPSTSGRGIPVTSVESLLGMEVCQPILAGNVVRSDEVRSPILVKRGELITISSNSGGIRVRTRVVARQDGAQGDLVQVESLQTKERFDARVVGQREVAVAAIAAPSPTRQATPIRQAQKR